MNDNSTWILLYSKFSSACNSLKDLISSVSLPFELLSVCIDNKQVRTRILNAKDFSIQYVPCIIHIDEKSGVADQYEGEKSFELIQYIKSEQEEQQRLRQEEQRRLKEQEDEQQRLQQEEQQRVQEEQKHTTTPSTSSISDLLDITGAQNMERYVKKKPSAKEMVESIMKERSQLDRETTNLPAVTDIAPSTTPIEQKKTGQPVNISIALADARGRD